MVRGTIDASDIKSISVDSEGDPDRVRDIIQGIIDKGGGMKKMVDKD